MLSGSGSGLLFETVLIIYFLLMLLLGYIINHREKIRDQTIRKSAIEWPHFDRSPLGEVPQMVWVLWNCLAGCLLRWLVFAPVMVASTIVAEYVALAGILSRHEVSIYTIGGGVFVIIVFLYGYAELAVPWIRGVCPNPRGALVVLVPTQMWYAIKFNFTVPSSGAPEIDSVIVCDIIIKIIMVMAAIGVGIEARRQDLACAPIFQDQESPDA